MRLATRRSLKTVHGVTPALRPRLPSRDASVPLKSRMQGSWKIPVGEYFDLTGWFPIEVHAGFSKVFGRPVDAAEDEAMALVEGGGGTVRAGEVTVLWSERGLQVGRIVDRVRPSVRS